MRLRKWEELADRIYDQARSLAEQAHKLKEDGFVVRLVATPFAIELLKAGSRISSKECLCYTSLKFMGIDVTEGLQGRETGLLKLPPMYDLEASISLVVKAQT